MFINNASFGEYPFFNPLILQYRIRIQIHCMWIRLKGPSSHPISVHSGTLLNMHQDAWIKMYIEGGDIQAYGDRSGLDEKK